MKRWLRGFASILLSIFLCLAPNMPAYANTKDDECAAGGVRYYDCQRKCEDNRSCDGGRSDSVALIGDSISTDSTIKGILQSNIEGLTDDYYDARVGRPWAEGLDILKNNSKILSRDIIIFALGTNNDDRFNESYIQDVMDVAGNSKTVIFVTNYADKDPYIPWFEHHNEYLRNAANTYNNVRVADWAQIATDNSYTLDSMGVHPVTQEQREAFANAIVDQVAKGVCRTGPVELLGDTAEEKVWSGLLSVGWTKEQTAGIMGNMFYESGYNPAQHEISFLNQYHGSFQLDANPQTSYGLGLIQWSFQRRIDLYNYIKDKAPDLLKFFDDPETYSRISADQFLQQAGSEGDELLGYSIAFLYDELSSNSRYQGLLQQTTVEGASEYFTRRIEVPANMESAVANRKVKARSIYETYSGRSDLEPSNYVAVVKNNGITLASYIRGTNKNYNGDQVLTDEQIANIEEFAPFYQEGVKGTDIPWEMVAIVHILESSQSRTNPNDDGLFQILDKSYPVGEYVDDDEFVQQIHDSAEVLQNWREFRGELSGDDMVKAIFFGYNSGPVGGSYRKQARDLGFTEEQAAIGEGSPYVMNRYDAKRDPNKAPLGTWGQIKTDGGPIVYPANNHFGAFVMYEAIAGSSGSGCGGNGAKSTSGSAISDKAVELAWPVGDPHNSTTQGSRSSDWLVATDAYKTAALAINNWYEPGGADCSYFVGTVVAAAGVDPEFPHGGSAVQTDYLKNSPKWENLSSQNNGTDESFLRAGDIMIVPRVGNTPGHVRVVVDLGNGTLGTAEASLKSHSGELHTSIGLDARLGRGLYQVYRLK